MAGPFLDSTVCLCSTVCDRDVAGPCRLELLLNLKLASHDRVDSPLSLSPKPYTLNPKLNRNPENSETLQRERPKPSASIGGFKKVG